MDAFILNGTAYTHEQLMYGAIPAEACAEERKVLEFSRQWLTGQERFTIYTSGSTGTPKAIQLTRQQMVTSARWTARAVGLLPGDRALVCLSVDYIAGMMMLVRGFELGLSLTVVEPTSRPLAAWTPDMLWYDFTAMIPLQLHATLQGKPHERALLDHMKAVLIGGGPVSVALEQDVQRITAPIYHTYAMTETVSHIALRRLNGPQCSERFVPFEEVRLLQDARGCLSITSVLTRGETVHTNDLVELYADGSFRWLGRLDHVINSGGVKVQIEQVERAIEAWLLRYQGGIYADRRFMVGALEHPALGQEVVALIEGAPFDGGQTIASELETALRAQWQQVLRPYEVPRHIYFVEALLETRTGKVDRPANLQRLATQRGQSAQR